LSEKIEQQNENLNKKDKDIHLRVSTDELDTLKHFAKISGESFSQYIRKSALGYGMKSIYDKQMLLELIRMRGNFNQVGNLFKIYLDSSDKKFNQEQIKYLLKEFEKSHSEITKFIEDLESKIK